MHRFSPSDWTCIFVGTGMSMIPTQISRTLQIAACKLAMEKADSLRFSSSFCEGHMETEWITHSVGSRTGVLFKSLVEMDHGVCPVNFLLHRNILEAGSEAIRSYEESSGSPLSEWPESVHLPDDMYNFLNSDGLSRLN